MKKLYSYILYILLFLFCISCGAQTDYQEEKIVSLFNDDKKLSGYQLNLDGYDVSDHPFRYHFNCSESGYFAIHYVAKDKKLREFWKYEYFKKNIYEYDDLITENKITSKLLKSNLDKYNIFSVYIPLQNLDTSYGCTKESIDVKSNAIGYVYILIKDKWERIYTDNEATIPIYYPSEYFVKLFPNYFN